MSDAEAAARFLEMLAGELRDPSILLLRSYPARLIEIAWMIREMEAKEYLPLFRGIA